MCYVSGILFHISHFNSRPGSSSHTQLYAEEILNCGWRRLILELVLNASNWIHIVVSLVLVHYLFEFYLSCIFIYDWNDI